MHIKKSGLIPSINVHQILVGTPQYWHIPSTHTCRPPPPSANISVGLYIKGPVMFSKLTLLKQNKTKKTFSVDSPAPNSNSLEPLAEVCPNNSLYSLVSCLSRLHYKWANPECHAYRDEFRAGEWFMSNFCWVMAFKEKSGRDVL